MPSLRLDLIKRYLKPHKKELFLGGIALIIVNILSVRIPLEVKSIIDELKDGFIMSSILKESIWIIILASLMGFIRLLSRQLVFGVGRQVEVELRQRLFNHMLTQEPDWVKEIGSGEVISRATSDIENIRRLLGFAILSLTNTFLAYLFTLPAMFAINPLLTIAAISLYPIMLATVGLFGGRMVMQRKSQQESLSKLTELIQEDLSGISAIKIYGQENAEQKAFSEKNNNYRDAAINLARTASTLFPLLQGISSISLLVLLALGSGFLQNGLLTIGGLVALILYVERLVFPTALLGFTLNTFQLGQVSLERVEELLRREPEIKNKTKNLTLKDKFMGKLQIKNFTFRYDKSNKNVLNGITFSIEPGELVAIVGPVGCGKTTLSKALGRMLKIKKGQIFIDDHDITDLRLEDLRKNIAFVPQEGYLFTSTLSENISFGNPTASFNQIRTSAQQARLIEDINRFPDGFETLVGERGITLSGGQRQRTALSRALLVDAPILVLDDALASVDNKTAASILRSIRKAKNKTILLISHQLSAAAACDRIVVIEYGSLVQQGTHNELIEVDGCYKRLWERERAEEELNYGN